MMNKCRGHYDFLSTEESVSAHALNIFAINIILFTVDYYHARAAQAVTALLDSC